MIHWDLDRKPGSGTPSRHFRSLLNEPQSPDSSRGLLTISKTRDDASSLAENLGFSRSFERGETGLSTREARSAQAELDQSFADEITETLPVIGVTGSTGKSAVGSFLRSDLPSRGTGGWLGSAWFSGLMGT